ncbi:unnamed protein product [Colletotrichum noveboracense]|uniref:Uncharacterized protein n=1 Tax=Colletotrichum noveboracense TaxID=2664923 RepID=A0A9W4RRJ8_9PEZI|nr:unnamed protein product [Colletotrichum noveboracense]
MAWRVPPVDGFLVRENQGEREDESIDQVVRFSIAHISPETVCFRFSLTVVDGEHSKTVIYLQITPDHLDSLCHDICKLKGPGLPHLDNVRTRLGRKGGRGDLIYLRFQLRNDTRAQCIVPNDFPDYEALDDPARHAIDIFASAASSPSFSLYFPANQLSRQGLDACVEAVQRHSVLKGEELHSYQRAVQLQRLYGGKGGKVFAIVDRESSSQPETDSFATLGFDVVPRHQGSPPQYGDCSNHLEKPGTALAGATNKAESALVDCAPPRYGDTEQSRDAPVASKRIRLGGDEDEDEYGLSHPSSKRVLSRSRSAATFAPALVTKAQRLARSEVDDADVDGNVLLLRDLLRRVNEQEDRQLLQEQENQRLGHEVKRLQEDVLQLQRQNMTSDKRQTEVEGVCDGLEHQQDLVKDELENLQVEIGELEGKCGELEKQMPNVLDELEDLVRDTIRDTLQEDMLRDLIADLVEEHKGDSASGNMEREREGNLTEPLRAYVRENVMEQLATMKAKMRKALRG